MTLRKPADMRFINDSVFPTNALGTGMAVIYEFAARHDDALRYKRCTIALVK